MVLYIYSFFFLVFKGQQIQTVLNTTSKYNFPMKAATVQHVRSHSHPLPPAQASWQRQLLLKNKIHIFNISSSKSYHVLAQNKWVRQTRPALKNTGDRHGNEPAALEPLGFPWLRAAAGTNSPGGAEVRTGTNRNNQELEDLLLQGQVRAHFPCSPEHSHSNNPFLPISRLPLSPAVATGEDMVAQGSWSCAVLPCTAKER